MKHINHGLTLAGRTPCAVSSVPLHSSWCKASTLSTLSRPGRAQGYTFSARPHHLEPYGAELRKVTWTEEAGGLPGRHTGPLPPLVPAPAALSTRCPLRPFCPSRTFLAVAFLLKFCRTLVLAACHSTGGGQGALPHLPPGPSPAGDGALRPVRPLSVCRANLG